MLAVALVGGCATKDRAQWPPKEGAVHVIDMAADSTETAYFAQLRPRIEAAGQRAGLRVADLKWWIDGSYPWRVTPAARVSGATSATIDFHLDRLDGLAEPVFVTLDLSRSGTGAPWVLSTYDGFLSPPSENGDREVLGNPAFEVAFQQIFPTQESPGFPPDPTADLKRDSLALREFAKFLSPYDSAMQAIVRNTALSVRDGSPYEWFGVAPVDAIDQRMGLREGVLRLYVRENDKPSAQWLWFELLFARPGPSEPWTLLEHPAEGLVNPKRSSFHASARRAEDELRGIFPKSLSMQQWWATRSERRSSATDN